MSLVYGYAGHYKKLPNIPYHLNNYENKGELKNKHPNKFENIASRYISSIEKQIHQISSDNSDAALAIKKMSFDGDASLFIEDIQKKYAKSFNNIAKHAPKNSANQTF